jgi:sulfite reductase alpha subunit-like flavoprotein
MYFPSTNPPIERIFESLSPLQPRSYSITTSQSVDPNLIGIIFHVTEFEASTEPKAKRRGVCTGWIDELLQCDAKEWKSFDHIKIPICHRPSLEFRIPASVDQFESLILIGPGTGVAPFLSFMEHRLCHFKEKKCWLFFGCRVPNEYMFEKELNEMYAPSRLNIAYSRLPGQTKKTYVQDLFEDETIGRDLYEMLVLKSTRLYVCG